MAVLDILRETPEGSPGGVVVGWGGLCFVGKGAVYVVYFYVCLCMGGR